MRGTCQIFTRERNRYRMTLHIARLHDQGRMGSLDVFLDERRVAHLTKNQSVDVNGNGQPQALVVREGGAESPVLMVTDPGPNRTVGIVVSYRRFRALFKPASNLLAEFL